MAPPGRTFEIPVACAKSSTAADPDISIPVNRCGSIENASEALQQLQLEELQQREQQKPRFQEPPQTPLHVASSSSSGVYEIPVTPGPRSKGGETRNISIGDPTSRHGVMTPGGRPCASIFEIPPTPPGGPSAPKPTKIREISVTTARTSQVPPAVQIHQQEAIVEPRQAVATPRVREISVIGKGGGAGKEACDSGEPAENAREATAGKHHPPPLRTSESSFIDFSLFLIKNARAREQIRGSLTRGLDKKEHEPEEDLETLLLRWEKAQLEEAAAARAKEEEMLRASPVQPAYPALKDLPWFNVINSEGKIEPHCEPNTAVSVFAVYDRFKKVQYIGISNNIKTTLRKIVGRKPGYSYFYKIYDLPHGESPQPHAVKQRWIEELGSPPPGNADPMQQKEWEQALDVGTASGNGGLDAAIQKVKALIQIMVERGLKEEMVYDPALMELGRCDVLETTTPADAPKGKHTVIRTPYGGSIEYYICYNDKSRTNTGWKYDISLNKDNEETRHIVTCGSNIPGNLSEDSFLELIIGFLLHKRMPRTKEWRNNFNMSKFSVGELMENFDDFKPWFPRS